MSRAGPERVQRSSDTGVSEWTCASQPDRTRKSTQPSRTIAHRSMLADPLATVRLGYDRFDLSWTNQAEPAFTEWISNPVEPRRPVNFGLEDFELDGDGGESAVGHYLDRFGRFF